MAIKELVIFSAKCVSVSYCTPLKFNKVFLPSPVDVHTICLISETTLIVCWLSLLQNILSLLLLVARRFRLSAAPIRNNWYQSISGAAIDIRGRSTRNYLQSRSI